MREELWTQTLAWLRTCQLLQTMPSVGPFTALLMRAEIGDVDRFSGSEKLVSYIGLGQFGGQST
jgi:transposase